MCAYRPRYVTGMTTQRGIPSVVIPCFPSASFLIPHFAILQSRTVEPRKSPYRVQTPPALKMVGGVSMWVSGAYSRLWAARQNAPAAGVFDVLSLYERLDRFPATPGAVQWRTGIFHAGSAVNLRTHRALRYRPRIPGGAKPDLSAAPS